MSCQQVRGSLRLFKLGQERELAAQIEGYYYHERRHSTIGSLSPIECEQRFIASTTLTPVSF